MKNITIIIALLISLTSIGQTSEVTDVAFKIIKILEGTQSIQEYSKNRKVVLNQLEDINYWTKEGKISQATYLQLQSAYNHYYENINVIISDLTLDISRLYDNRKLKKSRLKKVLKNFSSQHVIEVNRANEIYLNEWSPAMEKAMIESESKGGIIVSIVAIFKIGETVFHAIKDLISTGSLNKEAEEQLMLAALKLTKTEIRKKLSLPEWDDIVIKYSSNIETYTVSQGKSQQTLSGTENEFSMNPRRSNIEQSSGFISISEFGSDAPVKLRSASKRISVGSEKNSEDIDLFATAQTLVAGDRFWVKLKSDLLANFFYFDHDQHLWQDPFGKGIVVGSAENQSYKYLPAKDKFFEIVGASESEEFLIILSNYYLSANERHRIMSEQKVRDELLSELSSVLPNAKIMSPELRDTRQNKGLLIPKTKSEKTIIPIYIIIEKTNLNP